MRIDVVTIFPDYLAPLELSLIGRARRAGLLDVRVRDLREYTHDRHRTVDDTPYGGGAGMVMRPEPWGEALDALLAEVRAGGPRPHLVVPGPGGHPFTQARARELAAAPWLVFACGRYEGIDERVYEQARERFTGAVSVLSLGDYVLNGGEVAALAMVEAIVRLLPGVVGNAESLREESYEDGLLEYPVYTRPPVWNGREVPAVLRSGDHGAIGAWRQRQRLVRTAERRPDLLSPAQVPLGGGEIARVEPARPVDATELHVLALACWASEARAAPALDTPDVGMWHERPADAVAALREWRTWVMRSHGRLVGSVRARLDGDTWRIGRLMIAPDRQGQGLGRTLLGIAEAAAPREAREFSVHTGEPSERSLRFYRKAGYRVARRAPAPTGAMGFVKRAPQSG